MYMYLDSTITLIMHAKDLLVFFNVELSGGLGFFEWENVAAFSPSAWSDGVVRALLYI